MLMLFQFRQQPEQPSWQWVQVAGSRLTLAIDGEGKVC